MYPFLSDLNTLQTGVLVGISFEVVSNQNPSLEQARACYSRDLASNYTTTEQSATPKVPSPTRHFPELAVEIWFVVTLRFWGKVKRQQ
ncbi:uncharacterized protein FPRO_01330 [Fusarium proliferatum ET1]|uniref:Uncharacterized protein n=1 Tax=Fusarium proliferatum (strain ET1) TaxID=1227346 RepID=A0A1L7V0S1_FUSPR|nr:uncharacterized protein FPRO_01330 [Fusarium proliferatum ET1]CZR34356.1 uncharacterized protein FPRO_01330 [Fusarium proliferatum ET1]